jgi:hypothetical protein
MGPAPGCVLVCLWRTHSAAHVPPQARSAGATASSQHSRRYPAEEACAAATPARHLTSCSTWKPPEAEPARGNESHYETWKRNTKKTCVKSYLMCCRILFITQPCSMCAKRNRWEVFLGRTKREESRRRRTQAARPQGVATRTPARPARALCWYNTSLSPAERTSINRRCHTATFQRRAARRARPAAMSRPRAPAARWGSALGMVHLLGQNEAAGPALRPVARGGARVCVA